MGGYGWWVIPTASPFGRSAPRSIGKYPRLMGGPGMLQSWEYPFPFHHAARQASTARSLPSKLHQEDARSWETFPAVARPGRNPVSPVSAPRYPFPGIRSGYPPWHAPSLVTLDSTSLLYNYNMYIWFWAVRKF